MGAEKILALIAIPIVVIAIIGLFNVEWAQRVIVFIGGFFAFIISFVCLIMLILFVLGGE